MKNLSEKNKKIIILAAAFVVTLPILFFQIGNIRDNFRNIDLSSSPIVNLGNEMIFEKEENREEIKKIEESIKEQLLKIEEEINAIEEQNKEESENEEE